MSFSGTNTKSVIEQRLKPGCPLLPFSSVNYLAVSHVFAYTQMYSHTQTHTESTEKKKTEGAYGEVNLSVSTWTNNAVLH